jgi:hypothetical protein
VPPRKPRNVTRKHAVKKLKLSKSHQTRSEYRD